MVKNGGRRGKNFSATSYKTICFCCGISSDRLNGRFGLIMLLKWLKKWYNALIRSTGVDDTKAIFFNPFALSRIAYLCGIFFARLTIKPLLFNIV